MPASSHKKKGISLVQNHQNIVYFMHSRQQNGGLKPVFCVAEFRLASPVLRIWKKTHLITELVANSHWDTRQEPWAIGLRNEAQISPIQDARNSDMALFAEFAVRCVLDCSYPLSSAEGGDFLEASGWA